jgi:hypothetical protein
MGKSWRSALAVSVFGLLACVPVMAQEVTTQLGGTAQKAPVKPKAQPIAMDAKHMAASGQKAPAGVEIAKDDIGGLVSGPKGPEAGVWVIAETTELPVNLAKMVVTDDQGRYVIPQLDQAHYKIWVRGYGLTDSEPVVASPGMAVNLTAAPAADAKAAAQYYPANYWYALLHPPAEDQFPGTGPDGNGINAQFKVQQSWFGNLKENCSFCHQLGDYATREIADNSTQGWAARIALNAGMNNNFKRFGEKAALNVFTDWTKRIAAGELPPNPPPRPEGVERNIVITVRDWADGRQIHDQASSDHRDSSVNAGGPSYGLGVHDGTFEIIDPKINKTWSVPIPGISPVSEHNEKSVPHAAVLDQKGRLWVAMNHREGPNPSYCTNPANPFAKLYPMDNAQGRVTDVYDPVTKKVTVISECAESDHLNFDRDKDNTVYFSGEFSAMGWLNTRVWDATHDAEKAEGWCPMVIDTSGDGKIDPDSSHWNNIEDRSKINMVEGPPKVADPTKDTLIRGFIYGIGVSPKDHSVWGADYLPYVPGAVIRMDRGSHPPETCKMEYYEPPLVNGKYLAFNPRGVDVDSEGVAWVSFASGQIGRFDRRQCDVTNGPKATGQHCARGWKIFDAPGPKVTGTTLDSDHLYSTWIDYENIFGLGRDVPFFPGTNSDSLLAFLPKTEKWVTIRVPYPMGFYARDVDGRVDDPKAGWKGKILWAPYAGAAMGHQENGALSHVASFQMRPDPLAH